MRDRKTEGGNEINNGFALLAANERSMVPKWAKPGRVRYARCDGGSVEVAKAVLSGWDFVRTPDGVAGVVSMYSDETIQRLTEAEINWVWVTWSVGFAPQDEADQQEILRSWIAKCHAAGIKVTAYMSMSNMMAESIKTHMPGSGSWRQLDTSGNPFPYSSAKYYDGEVTRVLACLNNPGWIEFSKKRVTEAVEGGADAIFFDNCFFDCACPICRDKFREFCRSAYGVEYPVPGTVTEIHQPDNLTRTAYESVSRYEASDVANRAWDRLRLDTTADFVRQMCESAEEVKPGILVYINNHQAEYASEPCNALFTEDGVEPGFADGRMFTNIGFFKYLYAMGDGWKRILVEHGLRTHGERMSVPLAPRIQKLALWEAAACQGVSQTFTEGAWNSGLYLKRSEALEAWNALAETNRWTKEHETLFADIEPIAKVGVVTDVEHWLSLLVDPGKRNFVALASKHITPAQLAQFPTVVLWHIQRMSDEQVTTVLDYVRGGGKVIVVGETSLVDPKTMRDRDVLGLAPMLPEVPEDAVKAEKQYGSGICVFYPKASNDEPDYFLPDFLADWDRLDGVPLVRVKSDPNTVRFNLGRTFGADKIIVYLINYADEPVENVEVELNLPVSVKSVSLIRPDTGSSEVKTDSTAEGIRMVVPGIDILGVLVAEI